MVEHQHQVRIEPTDTDGLRAIQCSCGWYALCGKGQEQRVADRHAVVKAPEILAGFKHCHLRRSCPLCAAVLSKTAPEILAGFNRGEDRYVTRSIEKARAVIDGYPGECGLPYGQSGYEYYLWPRSRSVIIDLLEQANEDNFAFVLSATDDGLFVMLAEHYEADD